ncbi:MAG: DUF2490 domain-containing protein [Paludibacteraceae bacterium]|nr:DUF2490 domain-containing protein [Paludibacteraceae bacterium]
MKRFCLVLLALLPASALWAASADEVADIRSEESSVSQVGLRTGVSLQYSPVRHLQLDLAEEVRVRNNFMTFDASYTAFEISYKVHPNIRFGAGYEFQLLYKDGKKSTDYVNFWQMRHRALANVTGSYKYMRWNFSLREQYQATFRTDLDAIGQLEKANPKMVLRSRFKVTYSFFSKPVKPFASVEMYNPLNQSAFVRDMMDSDLQVVRTGDANYGKTFRQLMRPSWIDKMQYRLGVEWRLDAHSTFEFFYLFEHTFDKDVDVKKGGARVVVSDERMYNHALGVFYQYRF